MLQNYVSLKAEHTELLYTIVKHAGSLMPRWFTGYL